jgi:tRNA(Ile)-lysidine synthase
VSVPEQVRVALDRLLPTWATVPGIVAVSGGADSVALLRALRECNARFTIAHLNHQLRGTESDHDEAFVIQLASSLRVPVRTERVNIAALGGNLESVARQVRYEWLAKIATENQSGWIATGHTAEDQAETVLHRLIRGTGLQGLRAIAPRRNLTMPPSMVLLRPLLEVRRTSLLEYLDALGQNYQTDSSNADPQFTRNRIRAELLPLLKEFNPGIVNVLTRFSEHASEAFDCIEIQATQLLQQAERPRAGELLIFDRPTVEVATPFLVREMLRSVWRREGWPMDSMTTAHWHRAANLVVGDYPNGVRLRVTGRAVQIQRQERRGKI